VATNSPRRSDARPILKHTNGAYTQPKPGESPHVFKTGNDYLINLYDDEELSSAATIRKFRIVQTDGNRQLAKLVDPYRREAILSVEYRVRSQRGVQFRRWATSQLQDYPCQCDAILPIDSRPLPMVDEKTRGLSPRFLSNPVSQPARAVGRFKSAPPVTQRLGSSR
jgi:hypothetical protein